MMTSSYWNSGTTLPSVTQKTYYTQILSENTLYVITKSKILNCFEYLVSTSQWNKIFMHEIKEKKSSSVWSIISSINKSNQQHHEFFEGVK